MTTLDWIVLTAVTILVPVTLLWVWKKRHRLFFQSRYTAETVMMNYQDDNKRSAMEAVEYMNEEAEEDEAGESKKRMI